MTKSNFIYNLSVKNKMIAIILFLIFLTHSIGFTFITVWDIKRFKAETTTGLQLNTQLIANNCVVPLTFGDNKQATTALSYLKNINSIEQAFLLDNEGNLFATYPESLTKKEFPPITEHQSLIIEDGFIYISEAVIYQDKNYGTLYIKANTKPIKKAKRNLILTLVLLSIVLDLLAVIMANKLQRYVSKPIIDLKRYFERLTQTHDFSQRIEKQHNDEIGLLYDEFNHLIDQIQHRSVERDNAEQKLNASQEKLNLALQGGDIGIWEWDIKSDFTEWDSKMERMFGLEEGAFKQTTDAFKACLHPDDMPLADKTIHNALYNNSPYDIIYRVLWKTGETKYIRSKALISRDEDQNPIKMIGVCFDVTEIKKAEIELKKHRENLEEIVNERTKDLEEKNTELENFNQLFIDREFRIKELRDEVEQLQAKLVNQQ